MRVLLAVLATGVIAFFAFGIFLEGSLDGVRTRLRDVLDGDATPSTASNSAPQATPTSAPQATPTSAPQATPTPLEGAMPLDTPTPGSTPTATPVPAPGCPSPETDGQPPIGIVTATVEKTENVHIRGRIIEPCQALYYFDDKAIEDQLYLTFIADSYPHDGGTEPIGAVLRHSRQQFTGARPGDEATGVYNLGEHNFYISLTYNAFNNRLPYRLWIWGWRTGSDIERLPLGAIHID